MLPGLDCAYGMHDKDHSWLFPPHCCYFTFAAQLAREELTVSFDIQPSQVIVQHT